MRNLALLAACCLLVGDLLAAPPDVVEPCAPVVPLACTIRCPPTCELGQVPQVSVEIVNQSAREMMLVGSLDASGCKARFPHCYFEVTGPDGKSALKELARCGFQNGIRVADFVKVPSGGKFNPYQRIDQYGFFDSAQITAQTFDTPGEYRIRFFYSSASESFAAWAGNSYDKNKEPQNTQVRTYFEKVPKTALASNEIKVTILPRKE